MDVKAYLSEGERLEKFSCPGKWTVVTDFDKSAISADFGSNEYVHIVESENHYLKPLGFGQHRGGVVRHQDAAFIADARDRLPKYRRALEAVWEICEANNDSRSWVYDIISGVIEKALA